MPRLSKKALLIFVVATLAGACLHFLYDLFPNPVTAILSPVNESLWEHLKILVWPFLVLMLVLTNKGEKGDRGPWYLALVMIGTVMLGVGYLYHVVAGGASLGFDICLYVLLMGAGFLLSALFDHSAIRDRSDVLGLVVLAVTVAILLFTFLPPNNIFFTDLSGVNTWSRIPC